MSKPPVRRKPGDRDPEHPDIRGARGLVSERANEYGAAMVAMSAANAKVQAADEAGLKAALDEFEKAAVAKTVAQRKLTEAQMALERELTKPRRA